MFVNQDTMSVETLQSSDALLSEQQRTCPDYEPVVNGSLSAKSQEDEEVSLEGPYDRLLGDTEQNWCRAVSVGTGITVLGFLFRRPLSLHNFQTAIDIVQVSAHFLGYENSIYYVDTRTCVCFVCAFVISFRYQQIFVPL